MKDGIVREQLMQITMNLNAEQKGVLLKELLAFLLAEHGKAKKEDVVEHFLNKSREWQVEVSNDEYIDQVELLAFMCVKAEWIRKTGFWKVTEHGKKAYERFSSPRVLFQQMAVQFVVRGAGAGAVSRLRVFLPPLIAFPCTLIGFLSANPYLFSLSVIAVFLLAASFVFYNSRTRLVILWQIFMIEFLLLCGTLVLDVIFANTSWREYFPIYFFATLLLQVASIALTFLFPHFFADVVALINRSFWGMIISLLLLGLLFGGKSGGGLLEMLYGENVVIISGTIVVGVLTGIGMIYLYGGVASQLIRVGYYD